MQVFCHRYSKVGNNYFLSLDPRAWYTRDTLCFLLSSKYQVIVLQILSCRIQSPSPHVRSIEAISGITSWTTQWAEALTHPLRLLHLQLKGSGTLINLLQLSKMAVENTDDLGELYQDAGSAIVD